MRPPLLIAGHGTRDAAGVAGFLALADRVRRRFEGRPGGPVDVAGGFIELSAPPLTEAVAALADPVLGKGHGHLVALPLVLVAAGHGKGDIPGAMAREQDRRPGLTYAYGRPLGPHPLLLDLLAERVDGALAGAPRAGTTVLLVGRGSTDPDANAEVVKVSRLLWEGRGHDGVETAFVSLAPPGVPAGLERARRLGATRIVVAPYFLFAGVLPDRVAGQAREWAAEHPDVDVRVAPVIGDCDGLAELVEERYAEALGGDIRMNCDTCVYRIAMPGFEHRVGMPQAPHDHPDDPAGAHGHGHGHGHPHGHWHRPGDAPDPAAGLRFHGDAELRPGLTDLAVNVNPAGPPDWLRYRVAGADLARYPDLAPARAAVGRRHGRPPAEVLLTAGAAEAFVLLARTLAPRLAVVVHPQFTEPEAALRAAGREPARVLLAPPFTLDPALVPDGADLVLVGNPTNPTSVLHPAAVLGGLARPGRTLVVDEAFMDAVPGEPESLAGRRDLPGLVVVRSLTKTWAIPGLRAGYLLAAPELVDRLAAQQPAWPVSAAAAAAAAACSEPAAVDEAGARARLMLADTRTLLEELAARVPAADVVPGAAAGFVLLRVPGGARVRERLRAAGWAVRRGETFPGLGPDWLRVAVRDAGTSAAFARALAAAVQDDHPAPPKAGRPDRPIKEPVR